MKKKILKLLSPLIIMVLLNVVIIFIGILASYQFQKGMMSKKFNDEQGANKQNYTGINLQITQSVEQYRGNVKEQADLYDIGEYTDLLLAIMMQESGGLLFDVFQCSESLGLDANSLNTQESIVQGVKLLAGLLKDAGVTSPSDIEHIRLALQAYNFGSAFIKFAIDMDGGWSQRATDKFAEIHSAGQKRTGQKAITMGIWKYGDQYYTDHVLRYYSFAITTESSVVEFAMTLLGCPYKWGATGPGEFDCSGLVYYVFKMTGTYSGARNTASGYSKIATPIKKEDAQPGDVVFFTNATGTHHIGIYIGNGQMIHAPMTGDVVKISSVDRKNDTVTYGRLSNQEMEENEDE